MQSRFLPYRDYCNLAPHAILQAANVVISAQEVNSQLNPIVSEPQVNRGEMAAASTEKRCLRAVNPPVSAGLAFA
jgi:hypothetical protein